MTHFVGIENWPPCSTCGKKPREGNHATDMGQGHNYVPVEHCTDCGWFAGMPQKTTHEPCERCPACKRFRPVKRPA